MIAPLFDLGAVVATPGALSAMEEAGVDALELLGRHVGGDWGDLDGHDRGANKRALKYGTRLLSSYKLPTGGKVWIISEASREVTTILLPSEY
jgi:hypothetical protein